jgi:2-polyprenyl-3-methyl-5-hydroxy-6-metoxy-1,4-benzoquinol methylase
MVLHHVPPGAEIVDVGCGTGATAVQLRSMGYKVKAADMSDSALAACREAKLDTIDLREGSIPQNSADCVLACDVLEHVDDDVALLIQLRHALRTDGVLIVTVPAYEFLWSGEDYVSEHCRRYRRSTLLEKLKPAGLEPVWCSYFNTFLSPLVAAAILAKRVFRPREMYESNIHPLPDRLNHALYSIFALERLALRELRFAFGTSILLIARPTGRN